ncbi:transaldolase [Alicyclobacillus kakegawensis]|uniref:transaldolase n=1 Tax=Alicyclobacillus kakegawensis TaxID=392012 RepID=UPI00082A6111|nr:transaldolase [Alicyclobacillus kakegawensis]
MKGLHRLRELGQSVWLDNIERGMIASGQLKQLVDLGVSGVTSNPSIFERAITQSTVYNTALLEGVLAGKGRDELYDELVVHDIRDAADILRPVFERTEGQDGFVSVEVSPLLAYDETATVEDALRLWDLVNRPNVMIKVPATDEGIRATRTLIYRGIPVNVTLIFGIQQYRKVMDAYVTALADRRAEGLSAPVASVASFFLSRLDDAVDKAVSRRNLDHSLLGKAALANAKVAYAMFHSTFLSGDQEGMQRILWASTGPKNPAYPYLMYVRPLVGEGTVNTMPPSILHLSMEQDYYEPSTVTQNLSQAHSILEELRAIGIDTECIAQELLTSGLKTFEQSYLRLLQHIEAKALQLSCTE